jgi:hypothetical protein
MCSIVQLYPEPIMVRTYKRKDRPAIGRQEIQKFSMKDRRTKIAFALGSLLFIVLALNRLCAAIVLPGSRSAIASSAHCDDDIEMLQRQLIQGGLSVRQLIAQFIERIHALDQAGPAIHSVIELNPDALAIATKLDSDPVHGFLYVMPILLKDNIDTCDRIPPCVVWESSFYPSTAGKL